MQGSATVSMAAPADKIWDLIADVRNTGRFSPEVFEAEWLGGATGPALGARFRGHVKRNEMGPVYWTTCRVTACEPGREFGFDVLVGDTAANTWHYRLTPVDGGTEVTEFWVDRRSRGAYRLGRIFTGRSVQMRPEVNRDGMRRTLQRLKAELETEPPTAD